MPLHTALATVSLEYTQNGDDFHVKLIVNSRSYDHPDPDRRCSAITEVLLPMPSNEHHFSNFTISDRYGVQSNLWRQHSGLSEGWGGYTEYDSGGHVEWQSYSGIYDDRCLLDPVCDSRRLQTSRSGGTGITAINYLRGPVTFEFDARLTAPPTAVELTLGLVGGNGGDVTRRNPAFPNERFIVQFP